MKRLALILALAGVLGVVIPRGKGLAEDCPGMSSYMIDAEGNCIDLGGLSQPRDPSRRVSPASPRDESADESTVEPEANAFSDRQGVFFIPRPSTGLPASRIDGQVQSLMPIEVTQVFVVYEEYRAISGPSGANPQYRYRATRRTLATDRLAANNIHRVSFMEEGKLFRVIGVGWRENGRPAHSIIAQPHSRTVCNTLPGRCGRRVVDPLMPSQ
jgi:hypothetical protein